MPIDRPMKLTLESQTAIIATVTSATVVSPFDWSQREPIRHGVMVQIKVQQTTLVKGSVENLQKRSDTYLGVLERTAQQIRPVRSDTPT